MDIQPEAFFQVDLQDTLPASEVKRRQSVKERLESQFKLWQTEEQYTWLHAPRADTISFLGLDWSSILPSIKDYFTTRVVAFELFSELQLCTIRAAIVNSYQSQFRDPPDTWLYRQYRQYAIRIQDLGDQTVQYNIPLIDIAVKPTQNMKQPNLFDNCSPDSVANLLPRPTTTFRLILFPQTRYSFIEDEIFHALYPLPEEQVKSMSHNLLRLQGGDGFYNALPTPFTDFFVQKMYNRRDSCDFRYLAAMYPIIDFELVVDYEKRKRMEKFIALMQQQNCKSFPAITQWRYSRKFDFAEESQLRAEPFQGDIYPERIQSARALFEYACGDNDTLKIDLQQTSLLEGAKLKVPQEKHLLVIDPLWLLVFPKSNTICAFRNETGNDPFKGIWGERLDSQDWGQVLIQIVNKADKCMGSYEPTYRKRLSKLQYEIHLGNNHELVKNLSDFVAEMNILLEPLQIQIDILQQWQQWQQSDWPAKSQWTDSLFDDAIKVRQVHLESLKRLRDRARESQQLIFQVSNTETAFLQSKLAVRMEKETKVQVELAMKNDYQNKSILIFTIITVIFLPLSFFTSYFGMNTRDIRQMNATQRLYWTVAAPVSMVVIIIALLFAFRAYVKERFLVGLRSKNAASSASMGTFFG
ncbi:hypothetical protein AOQ84DRAFT_383087 [Glonium stellatum]|uniref:Uncharacterized protein n=1 Tax=Glonium stellatum TaxID=574774 RepID=A0A8E2ENL7_9PEZI|nr:hypothetical protein AOQ84DRAFT_383087 [Glonium stellatum]